MQSNNIELAIFHAVRLGGRTGPREPRLIHYYRDNGGHDRSRLETFIDQMVGDNVLKKIDEQRFRVDSQWLENTRSDALILWHALDERQDDTQGELQLTGEELGDLRASLGLERPLADLLETLHARGALCERDGSYSMISPSTRLPRPILGTETFR